MTLFAAIVKGCGLTYPEAAAYLEVSESSVKSWASGRRGVPAAIYAQLHDLADQQERAAQEAVDLWDELGQPDEVSFALAGSEAGAREKGWPCINAQLAVARRLWEMLPADVALMLDREH